MVRKAKVVNADLIFIGPVWRVTLAFLSGVLGVVGFAISWIAVELAFPFLFSVPDSLLTVVSIGAYTFAILAFLRNQILKRLAKQGFLFVIRSQRLLQLVFWGAMFSATYGMLARTGRIPEYSPILSLLCMGLYLPLAMPWLVFGRLVRRTRESRLFIMQFLSRSQNNGTAYSWLRQGLSGVERQFRKLGYPVSKGDTYAWGCYSLSTGVQLEAQLKFLGDWVRKPQIGDEVQRLCTEITVKAREADRAGYRPPRSTLDIPGVISSLSLPRWWDRVVSSVIMFFFLSFVFLVAGESNFQSIPPGYSLEASLGFLAIGLGGVFLIMRRKPPAQALKLVHRIYPTILGADDSFDENHFWQLAKLVFEEQEVIQGLGPSLQKVAPGIFDGLSKMLSTMGSETSTRADPREISKRLFLNPQSRRMVSDLREDCEEFLSRNAWDYPDS